MASAIGSPGHKVVTEVNIEFLSSLLSFRKVRSLISTFPFSQKCDQEGEVLWLMVAVPTPETGSCLGRKRVEKGHSPAPPLGSVSDTPSTTRVLPTEHQGSSRFGARVQRDRKKSTGFSLLKMSKHGLQGTMWSESSDCWSGARRKECAWPVWVLWTPRLCCCVL